MLNEKNSKLKYILIIIILGSLLIVSGIAYTSKFLSVIQPGSMTETASYVIFIDEVNYYAKNGMTGEIKYPSSDAGSTINYVITELSNGGKIHISKGTFEIYSTILMNKPGIILEGEYGATKLKTHNNIPLIKVVKPSGNVNLGSKISNLILQGPGWQYTNAHGIYVDDAWGLDVENIVIGDCRHGIHIWKAGLRTLENLMIEGIGEWELGECYRGIFQDLPAGDTSAGLLSMWNDIDIGFCISDAIYIKRADSIWATNIRLLESGGSGLKILESVCYSNFANVQIDVMHENALHLENMWETSFNGLWASTNTDYDVSSIYIANSRGIDMSNVHVWSGNPPVHIINSNWIVLNTGVVLIEGDEDPANGIIVENSDSVKLIGLQVEADRSSLNGIWYKGGSQPNPLRIIGCAIDNDFNQKIVSEDPNTIIVGSP